MRLTKRLDRRNTVCIARERLKVRRKRDKEDDTSEVSEEVYYYFQGDNSTVVDTSYTPPENGMGLGFINYQNQAISANNLTFSGNVIADTVNIDSPNGDHTPYTGILNGWGAPIGNGHDKGGITGKRMASVGSFIGFVADVNFTSTDINLNKCLLKK